MAIKFLSKLSERRDELFLVARGEDRPNIIAEVTGFLESEGLWVSSIAFNLTSSEQDQFSMDIVAKGPQRGLEKCHLAFDSDLPLPGKQTIAGANWPKIRWARASMFHIGLNTPDRAGIVASISRLVGSPAQSSPGTFVHLLGITENSGDSAQGGTPYFSLRANVAVENRAARDGLINQIKTSKDLGFADDLWIVPIDREG